MQKYTYALHIHVYAWIYYNHVNRFWIFRDNAKQVGCLDFMHACIYVCMYVCMYVFMYTMDHSEK